MTDELRAMRECPACGELYPAGQQCECGYCDHAGTPVGETCPVCDDCVTAPAADLVAELLDAADAMVAAMGNWLPSARMYDEITRLRRAVTQLQGTAGLSVPAGGAS